MKSLTVNLVRGIALALICALSMSSALMAAPKPVNPETVHRQIVQRGAGKWVCVDMKNCTALVGRITSVDEQYFGMQLNNYPEVTTIPYTDVLRVRNIGLGGKGTAILIAAGVGGSVILAVVAHNAMNNLKNNPPVLPGSHVLPQ
jgi:hypothetical protein